MTISITSDSARFATVLVLNNWLARSTRSVAAAAKAFFARFIASFHETRRREAALTIARYRHLIADSEIAAHRESKTKNPQ